MGYTIIPQEVKVDNITIEKNLNQELMNKAIFLNALNNYKILESTGTFNNNNISMNDIFTGAAGKYNSVDTGNTTAYFYENKYLKTPGQSDGVDDNNTLATEVDVTGSEYQYSGTKIITQENLYITNVAKHPSCTATTLYIYDSNFKLLTSAPFSGDNASVNIFIPKGEVVYIFVGSGGNSYTLILDRSDLGGNIFSLPYIDNTIEVEYSYIYSPGSNTLTSTFKYGIYNISSITTQTATFPYEDRLILKPITLTGSEKYIGVYLESELIEGSNILVDISDGTNIITDQPVNTTLDISNLGGGNLQIIYKLHNTIPTVTPVIYGYGIILI